MREARADLAGLDEAGVRAGNVAGLEEPQHREAVLEVALLDAVDVRVVKQASRAVDPAAAAAEVALEAEPLGELASRSAPPGAPRLSSMQHLVRPHPVGEALLVVAGEVRRGREPVEVVDVERRRARRADSSRYASPHRWLVAGRSRVLDDAHAIQSCRRAERSGEEGLGGLGQRAEEHPHLGDPVALEPVDEGVARLERLAVAAQAWRAPTRRPSRRSRCRTAARARSAPSVASNNEPTTSRNPPSPGWSPAIGCGPRRWNTRSSVKIFASVSWSWSKIASVIRLTVSTFGWSVLIGPPWPVIVLPRGTYEAEGHRRIGQTIEPEWRRRLSSSTDSCH